MPRTLLIPALLDDWFPLLRHAFASREWEPVLLREERGLADRGMRYFHNELCYPVFLVAGLSVCQMMTIFAAEVSPGYYVFSMVLRAC